MLSLQTVKQSDFALQRDMAIHYSQPKGFVGRNICYAVTHGGRRYGSIVGGSATLHLVGRDAFFGIQDKNADLRRLVNNIFYHVEPGETGYPMRNFTSAVLRLFRRVIATDWSIKYRDTVLGFESLVELPRIGTAYHRDGWTEVGLTKGETCKRTGGKGTDSWSGKRVWDTVNLRPKRVFTRFV